MILDEFKETFFLKDRDHKFLKTYDKEKLEDFIQELKGLIDGMANACNVIRTLIEYIKQTNEKLSNAMSNTNRAGFYEGWLNVSTTHQEMLELLGFSTLLRMDVSYMLIQLLSAETETEKKIACKHSYTIVAEARNNDLFDVIASKMKRYPKSILSDEEFRAFWKNNKSLLKQMTTDAEANRIRNCVDSHKAPFVKQMETYASIDYVQCVIDMTMLILVTQNVDSKLRQINNRIGKLIHGFEREERHYMIQLEAVLKQLSEEV